MNIHPLYYMKLYISAFPNTLYRHYKAFSSIDNKPGSAHMDEKSAVLEQIIVLNWSKEYNFPN